MPSRFLRHLSCYVLLLLAPNWAWSAVALSHTSTHIPFYEHVEIFEDPTGMLGFEEVKNASFRPSSAYPSLNMGYKGGAIWLKLVVRSEAKTPKAWRLVFDYASLDQVFLYDQDRIVKAGDQVPRAEQLIDYRSPVFEISLTPTETRTLYLRASSNGSLTLTGKLVSLDEFERLSRNGYMAHSLYFGIFLALALYNLLLFFVLRERPFLNYVLFLTGFVVGMASLNGYGSQFIWTGGEAWSNRILPLSMTITELLAVIFTRSFLGTKARFPAIDRWLRFLQNTTLLVIASSVLSPSEYATQIMSLTGICFTLALVATGFFCVYHRVPGATLFSLAWLVLILGSALMALRNIALLPSNFITLYAMQIGSALEMILLSLALASRFNTIKREREAILRESERTLEQRVFERTEALEQANLRLSELALKDPLTTLANRNALRTHIEALMARDTPLALMLIDLDAFKPINDRYGHEVGDLVLVEVAKRLRRLCIKDCLAARIGGDEFVVVCENHSLPEAQTLGEYILDALRQPIEVAGHRVQIGASIGFTSSRLNDTKQTLLKRADNAMYAAKAKGRNCFSFAEDAVAPSATFD